MMSISSRTPEGLPNHCPVCGEEICIEPSVPPGDAPCPVCGSLLWFCALNDFDDRFVHVGRAQSEPQPISFVRKLYSLGTVLTLTTSALVLMSAAVVDSVGMRSTGNLLGTVGLTFFFPAVIGCIHSGVLREYY